MDVGMLFALDSVQVKVDDKEVAINLYTPSEVQALHRGGVQRVYLGNLRAVTMRWLRSLPAKGRTSAITGAARP